MLKKQICFLVLAIVAALHCSSVWNALFSSCPFLAPPTCIPRIWFDQKDNTGQTSVIDVHLHNVFKQFYMENLLRQQLWNQQMPALLFFIVPTPHRVVEKPMKVHYDHSPLEPVLMVLFWVEWPLLYIQGNIPLQRFKSQILTMTNLLSGLPFAASRGLYTEFSRAMRAELKRK